MKDLTPQQRKKIEKLANLVEKGDMAILEHLFEIEAAMEAKHEKMIGEFQAAVAEIKASVPDLDKVLATVKGNKGDQGDSVKGDKGDAIKGDKGDSIKGDKGDSVKGDKGDRGDTPDIDTIAYAAAKLVEASLTPLIPKIEDIEKDLPKLGERIRDSLELLGPEAEKLGIEAIKDLRKELDALKQFTKMSGSGKMGTGPKRNVVTKHSLTSQCDGITKAFTLPIETMSVIGVFGTQFPVQYDASGDWTFEGRTLTLGASVAAPDTGQTLWALIEIL